jgi:hypothetical protein
LQKQEACRKVDNILDQANDVFNTATVKIIDSAIFITQLDLLLTDPIDQEVISIFQTKLIKLQDLKVEQLAQEAICEQLDSEQIIKKEACRRADWILEKLKYLPEYEQIIENPKEGYDSIEFQIKINQLHELEIEYPTQKELCEQP